MHGQTLELKFCSSFCKERFPYIKGWLSQVKVIATRLRGKITTQAWLYLTSIEELDVQTESTAVVSQVCEWEAKRIYPANGW